MSKDLSKELRLGFLVHDVSRMRRNVVDRALRPIGVTRSQWWVMAFLSRRDGVSQVALAEELDVGKVAIGGLIDRLESGGWVERRNDPVDRRVKKIFLTESGQRLIRQIRGSVKEVEKDIVADVSEDDLDTTARALAKMKSNLQTLLSGAKANSEDDGAILEDAAPALALVETPETSRIAVKRARRAR